MAVIFEGEDLVVHETDGETDYAVVTFGAADQCDRATQEFFAERPLRKNGVKSIGVTCKRPEWFISPETEQVIALIDERLKNYSNRVIYGYSMGAHPALQWSKKLKATTVLCLCPKYSLDPDICAIEHSYVERYFCDRMKGMKIDPENVSGRIFLLHDPEQEHDRYHAQLIHRSLPDADLTMLPSFYLQHFVCLAFTGQAKFYRVIKALAYGNKAEITLTLSRERRTSLNNLEALVVRNIHLRPHLAIKALLAEPVFGNANLKPVFSRVWDLGRLSHRMSERGRFTEAALCRNLPLLYAIHGKRLDRPLARNSLIRPYSCAPLGFHGHLLAYDITNKAFVGKELLAETTLFPLVLPVRLHDQLMLVIVVSGEKFYLREYEGKIEMSDEPCDSGFWLERSRRNRHHHIRSRLGYLCSHPDGHYDLDSTNQLEWEEFAVPSELGR